MRRILLVAFCWAATIAVMIALAVVFGLAIAESAAIPNVE